MTTANNSIEQLLDEREVAEILHISVATVRRRRLLRQPPAFLKLGASVRYKKDSIRRLLESGERRTTEKR